MTTTQPGEAARPAVEAASWIAAAALILLAAVSLRRGGQDFAVYWRAAGRALGGEPLYPGADGFLAYRYAPGTALLFAPFAALPLTTAKVVWYALMVGCGVMAVRRLAAPAGGRSGAVTALVLLALARPLLEEFQCGQTNLVVLLLLMTAFAWEDEGRALRSGLLISLAFGLKLAPALLLADLALRRRWRVLCGFTLGAAAIAVAPVPWYGLAGTVALHRAWAGSLSSAAPTTTADGANQSILGVAARLGVPTLAAMVAAALLVAWVLRQPTLEKRRALLLFCMALASPMGWIQNYVIALPALFAVAHVGGRRAATAAAVGVLLVVPIYDVTGPAFEGWFFSRSLPFAAMAGFFALAAAAPEGLGRSLPCSGRDVRT